ncbi:peptidyl-prolyl cis-trans isomerase [Luteimonas sp. RD2P54]|uniref:Periplasmic chaperone PpiD n=1 Tax=Luteimonas endophytica TaxID=3042023 RepID=A0ABT6JAB8_9GAMM|nr:SurA N-terminal domain-containing protein [Luteimonas endophytica]MDH5823772.1 peptidyl-prolyl cis-trans isomerase [Luteimonas endophytica]
MLQALRDKMSGWIAIVIVILLAIPFAFFGMEQYLFQSGANYAAKVESPPSWWRGAPDLWPVRKLFWETEEVSPEDFRNAFEQERQQRREQQGEAFDPRAFESLETRREVLERLVDQAVLRLAARNRGMAVGDAQVRREIEQIPAFQVDGRFDPQRYQLALGSQVPARSPQQFQELIRESLQQSLIPTHVSASAFVTPAQLDRLLVMLGERRDVSFVMLPPPQPGAGEVGDAEIQAWYQANAGDFRAPETVEIEYVEIDGSDLQVDEEVGEAALRERYEQERSRFAQSEQRLASHILIEVPADADAAAQQQAEEQAEALAAQARSGDFAALAREHSDDTGSSAAGGDLGWVEQGMMVEAFEQALFAMEPGQVSEPVRTEFGWHVLQLRDVRSGEQTPFEEVRDELARELSEGARERAYSELVGEVVDQAYRHPNSLGPAAEAGGLTVRTAGPFARGSGEGIAAHPAVQRAAFSERLIEDETVSDPIEIGPGHSVLIRVTGHTPERALPLEEVRDQVVEAIRADRAAKRVQAEADAMLAEMSGGATLQAVAERRELPVQEVPGVPRGAPVPHPDAVTAYFAVETPEEGASSPGKAVLDDGSVVVFAVTAVVPGDPEEASEQERQMLQQQLALLAGSQDATAVLRALRERMKITVVEAQL